MQPREATKAAVKLLGVTVLMFGFGFALVPLYDLMCEVTGLNGKTGDQYVIEQTVKVDENRTVKIQFVTNNNTGMSWVFRPTQGALEVTPGKLNATEFYVHNPANKTIIAQAVPSVTPYRAAKYLHKTECFCFDQQSLAAGESMNMPLRFIIDSELPDDIKKLTLSYTLYDITERVTGEVAAN